MQGIYLNPASRDELAVFDSMDRQAHAHRFVDQIGLKRHQEFFDDPAVTYLKIVHSDKGFCGYFILVQETGTRNLEFRRILIDEKKKGIGQAAILAMEDYCRRELDVVRIWLDVYEDNVIGRHIYEKLGYKAFKAEAVDGRLLMFYEKRL